MCPPVVMKPGLTKDQKWPELHLSDWKDTCDTLHMWTQVVGKVRMELTPLVNHYWNVPLYVSSRGLTTSTIPYQGDALEIEFDFHRHLLSIETSEEERREIPLKPMSVADFYQQVMGALSSLGIEVKIWPMPVEVSNPIRFDQDHQHKSYDPEYAHRFWRVLLSTGQVLTAFRSGFIGKTSPVHFFWGSFDLACSRFSGRKAPERPGADAVTREAYSHEVISAGWWPGGGYLEDAAFYAYAAPQPEGFGEAEVHPAQAFYDKKAGEFFLRYEDVRSSDGPELMLMEFLHSTYVAGATLGKWDRDALEAREEAGKQNVKQVRAS